VLDENSSPDTMPRLAWSFIPKDNCHGVLIELATRYQAGPDRWLPHPGNAENRELNVRTVEMLGEYEPGSYIGRISPTPLLLVVARADHLTPAHLAIDAYEQAREPKKLVILPGGHLTRTWTVSRGRVRLRATSSWST
jgi:fermentation-respiration switch protein FrsA (DUF1100 family)